VTTPAHTHNYSVSAHTHNISLSNHTHTLLVPSHNHNFALPKHTHAILPGIFTAGYASNVTLKYGTTSKTYSLPATIDLTAFLPRDSKGKLPRGNIDITITPDAITRLNANIVTVAFVGNVFSANA